MKPPNHSPHQPVLLAEVLDLLRPSAGASYLDLTAGYGGHAAAVISRTGQPGRAVLVDRDQSAAAQLKARFGLATVWQKDYLSACRELAVAGQQFDMILVDLGVSSPHLDQPARGFSFRAPGPLDMRLDQGQGLTAGDIVNRWPEAKLVKLLRDYGQEPKARIIARAIVKARPLKSTAELAVIAKQAWPDHSRVHPATRTFQAIRIAVNDELNQLAASLEIIPQLLADDGRVAVISYHSGEDRLVKGWLAELSAPGYDSQMKLLTSKPVTPSESEIATNPRSRSAKLRAAVKIKTERN